MKNTFLLLIFVISGLSIGCTQANRPAVINHVVFFKLEDPTDAVELIGDCDENLSTISGVASYYCGEHGEFGRRNVNSDYDVGFYVGFDSEEAYRAYLDDPAHIAVVQKWKPRWEWIQIYDIVDKTP